MPTVLLPEPSALPPGAEANLNGSRRPAIQPNTPLDLSGSSCAVLESQRFFRLLLSRYLETQYRLRVVVQTGDGAQALQACLRQRPDFIFLDLRLVNLSGRDLILELRQKLPEARLLIVSSVRDRTILAELVELGIHAYLDKDDDFVALDHGLRASLSGQPLLRLRLPSQARGIAPRLHHPKLARLSRREEQVLTMVAQGASNKNIARILNLHIKTVEAHRARLCRKLGLHDVPSLTLLAANTGLISTQGPLIVYR